MIAEHVVSGGRELACERGVLRLRQRIEQHD
jgi:hypothetical protein